MMNAKLNPMVISNNTSAFLKNRFPEVVKMRVNDANEYLLSKIFCANNFIQKTVINYTTKTPHRIRATTVNPEKGFCSNFYNQCNNDERLTLVIWYINKICKENNIVSPKVEIIDWLKNSHISYLHNFNSKGPAIYLNYDALIDNNDGLKTLFVVNHELKHYSDNLLLNGLVKPNNKGLYYDQTALINAKKQNQYIIINYDETVSLIKSIFSKLNNFELNLLYDEKLLSILMQLFYSSSYPERTANIFANNKVEEITNKYNQYFSDNEKNKSKAFCKNILKAISVGDYTFKNNLALLNNNYTKFVNSFNKSTVKLDKQQINNFIQFYYLLLCIQKDPQKTWSNSDVKTSFDEYINDINSAHADEL